MRLLEEAGIYVLVSAWNRVGISALNLPTWEKGGQISFPYDYRYWDYVFSHIDAFHQYPNTLGFIIPLADLSAPQVRKIPWSKAMVRDVKEYIRVKGYRSIPVSSATYQFQLSTVPQYMNCGDRNSSVDFLGLDLTSMENVKTECRNVSSWLEDGKVEEYSGYSIPTYLLYGCNVNLRKDFSEIQAIFNNSTTKAFSGVILFEWLDDSEAWADFGESSFALFKRLQLKGLQGARLGRSERRKCDFATGLYGSFQPTCHYPTLVHRNIFIHANKRTAIIMSEFHIRGTVGS
jgi:hypothetical protein